mmetsp:Transcript_23141/g.54640  ORF Transcript_23141/g.54640 Transcript_23141/m.54640 type:complete len:206 (+) Transcript_23141:2787-3404(+)
MLDDVAVCDVPQCTENDNNRYVGPNVGQGGSDLVSLDSIPASLLVHLQVERRDGTRGVFHLRSRLDDPRELGGLFFLKGVDVVVGEAFLRDNDFFTPVDDKVTTLVVDAFPQIAQVHIILVAEHAKQGPQHDWHIPQKLLLGVLGRLGLPHVFRRVRNVNIPLNPILIHGDVNVEGRRIGEVSEARLVGEHVGDGSVLFNGGRFR